MAQSDCTELVRAVFRQLTRNIEDDMRDAPLVSVSKEPNLCIPMRSTSSNIGGPRLCASVVKYLY